MRTREESVRHLIEHCKSQLAKVKEEYEASLRIKKVNPALQIDVKNLMENLRSVLDYIAHDVYEKVVQPSRISSGEKDIKDIYFPYGKEENSFKSGVGKYLPKLDTLSPNVFLLIERVQPYKCGNNWLYDLCTILNQNKHNSLSPQEQHVTGQSYQIGSRGGSPAISAPAGAIIAPPGAIRIDNQPVIFNPNTGIPIPTAGLEVKVTTWIGFRFADTKVEVLPLLQLALKEINQLAEDIYKVI